MQLRIIVLAAVVLAAAVATGCGTEAPKPGNPPELSTAERLECLYIPRASPENPQPEVETFADCARRESGEIHVAAKHLAAIELDADGLGTILIAGQWYYIRADGTKMPVVTWDNWADDFAEGLVRTVQDGKIAYADKSFEVALPKLYDWGWPFDQGTAQVCRGCRIERSPGEEHMTVMGGKWGYIDRAGHEVVPVEHSREQAYEELQQLPAAPVNAELESGSARD